MGTFRVLNLDSPWAAPKVEDAFGRKVLTENLTRPGPSYLGSGEFEELLLEKLLLAELFLVEPLLEA